MAALQANLESIPGYSLGVDRWNEYAEEKFRKDAFQQELPDGTTRKRKAPPGSTEMEEKIWKKVQRQAWMHDKCFCGCTTGVTCCGCGLGWAPIVSIIPVFGPILMYTLHTRILTMAAEPLQLPNSVQGKIMANILFDLFVTMTPVLGPLFSWMNGCSERNAMIIWNHMKKTSQGRVTESGNTMSALSAHSRRNTPKEQQQEQQYGAYVPLEDMRRPPAGSGNSGSVGKRVRNDLPPLPKRG